MTFSISEGMFVEDFFEDGMLHVITLRSTVKRGKIVSVKIPEEIPESVTVLGAKDIPGNNRQDYACSRFRFCEVYRRACTASGRSCRENST